MNWTAIILALLEQAPAIIALIRDLVDDHDATDAQTVVAKAMQQAHRLGRLFETQLANLTDGPSLAHARHEFLVAGIRYLRVARRTYQQQPPAG